MSKIYKGIEMTSFVTREDLREILEEIFEARARIDSETHAEQHEWLRERIKVEKDRHEFYKEGVKICLQYSIPVILGAVYFWFKEHIK